AGPKGTTANAAKAAAGEMTGASAKRSGSAAGGRSSSLNISLMMSASGCRSPFGPTRYGPSRCCSIAATLRSTYTMMAAEFSNMTNTNNVSAICAMSNGVIQTRVLSMRACGLVARAPVGGQGAASLVDVRLVLVTEMLQRRQ